MFALSFLCAALYFRTIGMIRLRQSKNQNAKQTIKCNAVNQFLHQFSKKSTTIIGDEMINVPEWDSLRDQLTKAIHISGLSTVRRRIGLASPGFRFAGRRF
tara:strand:+ start:311 stop:613 length:303 start_codon:yes stop_codon:yes gene_type:complete